MKNYLIAMYGTDVIFQIAPLPESSIAFITFMRSIVVVYATMYLDGIYKYKLIKWIIIKIITVKCHSRCIDSDSKSNVILLPMEVLLSISF